MIVSAGEALIDLLPVSDAAGAPAFSAHVGGSPLNVAIALGRLGTECAFLGAISTDAFGARIVQALANSGVDLSLVTRVDRPTPLALVTMNRGDARYTFYDSGTATRGMTPGELKALPASATFLHFGSIALAAEPAASALIACASAARAGRIVCVDPNVRPAFAPDQARYRRNLEQAVDLADILKLSRADLAWLRPDVAPEDFAREQLTRGALLVVVTRGAAGAAAFAPTARGDVAGVGVPVRDTVGAGDAFTAGLLARLHETGVGTRAGLETMDGRRLMDALGFANRVGALACTRAGADPPRRDEVGVA
jgi:fructokinase